jgi:hypothetical protein
MTTQVQQESAIELVRAANTPDAPTPETDAAEATWHRSVHSSGVPTQTARRLERERNKALEALATSGEVYALDTQCLRAERDEARDRLYLLAANSRRKDGTLPSISELVDYRAKTHEALTSAIAQRDELLAELRRCQNEYIECCHDMAARHETEMEAIKAENQTLIDALRVRIEFDRLIEPRPCPLCDWHGGHAETCQHYKTESKVMQ